MIEVSFFEFVCREGTFVTLAVKIWYNDRVNQLLMEDFMSKDSKLEQSAKILSFHPTGEYYFSKGLKAYHQRDLYKAKKYLKRAQMLEPFEPMIACQLAIICTDLEQYQQSNNILLNIINDLDPFMSECHYFLANNYAHLGMFKEAYQHAKQYIDTDKTGEFVDDAEELMDLITLEHNGNIESLFEQDTLRVEQDKARDYLETGEFSKAIELLNKMIQESPDFWFAYNNLALAHYYSGNKELAFNALYEVLDKNPGNLHALCNLVVFHHAEKDERQVAEFVLILSKIRPIQMEQQYKLGATFALIGRYDLAYAWLLHLYKRGFQGDETYYYWLSFCAHQLGNEKSARNAWKKLLELNPEKEGLEPWSEMISSSDGFENQVITIAEKLENEHLSERLFGLFLFKQCTQQKQLILYPTLVENQRFTSIEKTYVNYIMCNEELQDELYIVDSVAEILYARYQPISIVETGLYSVWFSVYEKSRQEEIKLKNPAALAGAVDYIWHKMNNEPVVQSETANAYSISVSTLRKYVKMINQLLY